MVPMETLAIDRWLLTSSDSGVIALSLLCLANIIDEAQCGRNITSVNIHQPYMPQLTTNSLILLTL